MIDLASSTATQVVAALRSGAVSSREVLTAMLERIDRWNPELNAVVTLDRDRAFDAAGRADDAIARSGPTGPLHGLPMTVKDAFETAGMRTTSGATEYGQHVPTQDAEPVRRLRAAGAIVFGKTNLPRLAGDWQTANDVFGTTRNPWDTSRVPGGSSGGSAAALASGMSLLELGSDIGGSIRIPAHCCGVVGHKPTQGAVPMRGHIPGRPGSLAPGDLWVAGPMGRSVDDVELGLDVLLHGGLDTAPGSLPTSPDHAARRPRVALHLDDPTCPVGAEVRRLLHAAAEALERAGAVIVEAPIPSLASTHPVYGRLMTAAMADDDALRYARTVIESGRDAGDPSLRYANDVAMTHLEWRTIDEERHRIRALWAEHVFTVVDAVLAPVAPTPAFPHILGGHWSERRLTIDGVERGYSDTMLPWAGLATLPGLPATAVPIGFTTDGLPVGAQVLAARWADRTCFAVARLLEVALGGFVAPPLA